MDKILSLNQFTLQSGEHAACPSGRVPERRGGRAPRGLGARLRGPGPGKAEPGPRPWAPG